MSLLVIGVTTLVCAGIWGPVAFTVGVFAALLVAIGLANEHQRFVRSRLDHLKRAQEEAVQAHRNAVRHVEGLLYLYNKLQPDIPLPPFRDYSIKPDFAFRLIGEMFASKSPVVLELGSGVSTVLTAQAIRRIGGGRAVSYEAEDKYRKLTEDMLERHGAAEFVELHLAPLAPLPLNGEEWRWYNISEASLPDQIDVLVVDGPPGSTGPLARYPAMPVLYSRLRKGAVVFLDDGARSEEKQIAERWLKEFPALQREDLDTESGVIVLRKTEG